jgi:hypothetical protein
MSNRRKGKIAVSMRLPQVKHRPNKKEDYDRFRARAWCHAKIKPKRPAPRQLMLPFPGNFQMSVLVRKGTFRSITAEVPTGRAEIGFEIEVKTVLGTRHKLKVFRTGEAYLQELSRNG